jgi:hypothetical protein
VTEAAAAENIVVAVVVVVGRRAVLIGRMAGIGGIVGGTWAVVHMGY